MTAARLVAVRVLLALERHHTTLAAELERERPQTADDRDRALLFELTAGTLRWRNELDAILQTCSRRPIADLSAQVRTVLRLGAYQLRHLDRIPAHAIVHESVELIRGLGQARAAGFVNAVLRTLTRQGAAVRLPPRPSPDAPRADLLAYLSTSLSHPEWLVARWLDRHGFDAAARWCEFNNHPPDVTVRVLAPARVDETVAAIVAAGVSATPATWVSDAIRLPPGGLGHVPAELRSHLLVQDEASQIVALAVGAAPMDRILDTCASPGGKTVVMAGAMAGRGLLVACDHRPGRVRLLSATLNRVAAAEPAGASVMIVRLDATRPLPFGPVFDRVLVDAPCSGLGTVRRDPDVKWTRTAADLAGFAVTQRALLAAAADVLRPGGSLVYATCSSEPEENEDVVDACLAARPDLALGRLQPGPLVARGADLIDDRGMLRTLPFRDGLDAFFAALLVRRQAA
jgi:16S rRNA (cytosine967-C5)-methyltransferase